MTTNGAHEDEFRPRTGSATSRRLPGTSIEIIGAFRGGPAPRHALFDFDGTLSLIREGWADVMLPMFVERLVATRTSESPAQLEDACRNFVMDLNGKQTIYQMIRLAEEVERRGGRPRDALDYKREYHARLMQRIESRREALRKEDVPPDEFLVPGGRTMLELLRDRGLTLYLASGTDENYVREELELLGLAEFFGPHVYGARDEYRSFSKAMVIEQILAGGAIDGVSMVGFGDGFVEIQNVRSAGGTAIAVASDEKHKSGRPDAWKRDRLIAAGAHLVIPDFQDGERLIALLFGENP